MPDPANAGTVAYVVLPSARPIGARAAARALRRHIRPKAAKVLLTQADTIQREDALFQDPLAESD